MRLLALVLSIAFAHLVSGCEENELGDKGCKPDPYLCQIFCTASECVLRDDDAGVSCGYAQAPTDLTISDLNAQKCEEVCALTHATEESEQRCRFWRFEFDYGASAHVCSLMKEDQCTIFSTCDGNCKCGDAGCSDGTLPTKPGTACAGPVEYQEDHIHWTCQVGLTGYNPSPYSPGTTTMPPETTCTSVQKCADWKNDETPDITVPSAMVRKLQIFCDGAEGKWKAGELTGGVEADYLAVLPQDGSVAFLEPACTGGGAVLNVPKANIDDHIGTELLCENGPTLSEDSSTYDIAAPNSCILLCDHQLGMTIDSELNEDGEAVFKDTAGETISDGSTVVCWSGV